MAYPKKTVMLRNAACRYEMPHSHINRGPRMLITMISIPSANQMKAHIGATCKGYGME